MFEKLNITFNKFREMTMVEYVLVHSFLFRQIIGSEVLLKTNSKMLKELSIFSIGVVVGIMVSFAINGSEIDINVNHNINLPTGIVIGGATPTNQVNQSMSEE